KVRAFQTKGFKTYFSAFSAIACVATAAPPPPPQPRAPSGVSAALVPGIRVRVQWADNSTNEDGFRVERSADQVTWETVATIGPYCFVATALLAVLPADATSATTYWYGDCPVVSYLVAATKDGAYSAWAEVAVP